MLLFPQTLLPPVSRLLSPQQHYFKAHAYRIEPASPKGFLSIDGEAYPLEPYALEVHQGLGRFLSMYGSFQVDFDAPPSDGKKRLTTK